MKACFPLFSFKWIFSSYIIIIIFLYYHYSVFKMIQDSKNFIIIIFMVFVLKVQY